MAGRFEEAITTWNQHIERIQKEGRSSASGYLGLAAAHMLLGQEEKAHKYVKDVLKLQPKFSLEEYRKFLLFKEPRHTDFILSALRRAGLPECLTSQGSN